MDKYKKIILIILAVIVLYVIFRIVFPISPETAKNTQNLKRIQIEMSREEVIQIMGEPQLKRISNWEETFIYTSEPGMSGDFEIGISTKDSKVNRIYRGT